MKLVFVYNVNSGILDKIMDNAHKIVSPSTYNCNLCAITFGKFTEDELWKAFRQHADMDLEFYHKDEFLRKYKSKWLPAYEFPVILAENGMELDLFMDRETLNAFTNSEELIEEIKRRSSHY
jgi:hypothetical protein